MHTSWSKSLILANCGLTRQLQGRTSRWWRKRKCDMHIWRTDQTGAKAKDTKWIVSVIQMTWLGCKILKFCLFFIFHEINRANAKLIALVVCLLFCFSCYGFDDTLSGRNARLFPSTCWQMTDFILPSSKKRTINYHKASSLWVFYYCQSHDLAVSSTFMQVEPSCSRFAGFYRLSYSHFYSLSLPPIISVQ